MLRKIFRRRVPRPKLRSQKSFNLPRGTEWVKKKRRNDYVPGFVYIFHDLEAIRGKGISLCKIGLPDTETTQVLSVRRVRKQFENSCDRPHDEHETDWTLNAQNLPWQPPGQNARIRWIYRMVLCWFLESEEDANHLTCSGCFHQFCLLYCCNFHHHVLFLSPFYVSFLVISLCFKNCYDC